MDHQELETAADPDVLAERLPPAPGGWERTDDLTGTVEYRLPGDDGVCTAAKLSVRPDALGDAAVRLHRTVDCQTAGTDRFDAVDDAVAVVTRELDHVLAAATDTEPPQ
ncbi:MAG: hypothetical protein ACOC06_00240 [Halorubrum sp.]